MYDPSLPTDNDGLPTFFVAELSFDEVIELEGFDNDQLAANDSDYERLED
ncbi:MAG: hypothetical protein AAF493_24960 [Pseudomonadota bacterium]